MTLSAVRAAPSPNARRRSCCRSCRRACCGRGSTGSGPKVRCAARPRRAGSSRTQPGSTAREAALRIDLEDAVQVLGEIDHDGDVAALAGQAGAAAARENRRAMLAADRDGRDDIFDGPAARRRRSAPADNSRRRSSRARGCRRRSAPRLDRATQFLGELLRERLVSRNAPCGDVLRCDPAHRRCGSR